MVSPIAGFWARWRHAAKPNSWPKLLVPAFLGQALGVAEVGRFDGWACLGGLAFTVPHVLFVVFLNDWGDREVDTLKRQLFPHAGGPKTIPDGILRPRSLLYAGLGCGALAMAVAMSCEIALDRPLLGGLALSCLVLLLAYTFPPLRFNYRGGGEWLEALGVGVLLPAFHAYLQAAVLEPTILVRMTPMLPLSLASALASGLSDELSDRMGGKRTYCTEMGNAAVRHLVARLVLLSLAILCVLPWLSPGMQPWMVAPAVIVMLFHYRAMERTSGSAVPSAYSAQARYKQSLHRCIWWGMSVYAVCVPFSGEWLRP